MSKITNDQLNPVWHRMLYSCTHVAPLGVKGLSNSQTVDLAAFPIKSWLNVKC